MKLFPKQNFLSPAALARFYLTTAVGLVADLWSKGYAFGALATGWTIDGRGERQVTSATHELIPGWLHFHVTVNRGAVFGIGQGKQLLFVVISVAAIAFLTYLFANSGRQRFYQFVLGLLLAGVLGNMYDRLVHGFVRDMIYALPRWPRVFPWIFNVADVLLCVGVGLMMVHFLFSKQRTPPPAPSQDERHLKVWT